VVPGTLLDLVDELVESRLDRPPVDHDRPIRRWQRKPVPGGISAKINSSSARVIDVSYGGLRLGLGENPADPPPPSFDVVAADGSIAVPVELVWENYTEFGGVECGVAISSMSHETAQAWHGIVDRLS